jgi:hypothetical protein
MKSLRVALQASDLDDDKRISSPKSQKVADPGFEVPQTQRQGGEEFNLELKKQDLSI